MDPFEGLGRRAERAWARAGDKLAAFPGIATRLLREFEYGFSQDQLDRHLARRLLSPAPLPEQVSLHNSFGQPPVTLFNNGKLVVDLYFWITADTSIHDHGFRGAFRVLHGRSLHETFDVKVSRRIAPGVLRFEPGVPEMALLDPGDVRTILLGERMTHRVIHLENPTVTLCLKTINEPGVYQYEYHPDGLAIQRRRPPPAVVKSLYYYQYLLGRDAKLAAGFLRKLVDGLSVVARLNLYEEAAGGSYDLSEDVVGLCVDRIRDLHGGEEWFQRYEAAGPAKTLRFEDCPSPLHRLVAHFINGGTGLETAGPLLSRLAGREPRRSDIAGVVLGLMDVDDIFHRELSMEDRGTVKSLIARPERKIPASLRAFPQIQRMRDFIRLFEA
jgi:hypothetical protein